MKYIKKFILIIIVSLLIMWIALFYVVNNNKKYQSKLIEEVEKKYKTEEKIKTVNKYDNNYIVITKNKVIVLDSKYNNIKEEDLSSLAENINEYTLIYKNNKLMYEKIILKKDKVIYEYYDAYTYEYVNNLVLEG